MKATENDLKQLGRIWSEMTEAKEEGWFDQYLLENGDEIYRVLNLMAYERSSTNDQARRIGAVSGTASGF